MGTIDFPTDEQRQEPIEQLFEKRCSCVIRNHGETRFCYERGVKDLYRLLTQEPQWLDGAFIADKVVGKGAAALMILGGVKALFADIISTPALELLHKAQIEVQYTLCVEHIANRTKTGICPVEQLCGDCATAEECLPKIENFLRTMNR